MTFAHGLAAATLACLLAGSALAEGSADPQSNPHLNVGTSWTNAQASMTSAQPARPLAAPVQASRPRTLDEIHLAR